MFSPTGNSIIEFTAEGVCVYLALPQSTMKNESNEIIEGTLYVTTRERTDVYVEWRPCLVDMDCKSREAYRPEQTESNSRYEDRCKLTVFIILFYNWTLPFSAPSGFCL